MDGTKSLLASRTFWGAVLALIGIVAPAFHLTALASWAGAPATLDTILQVAGIAGGLLAIVGRIGATKTITLPTSAGPTVGLLAFLAVLPLGLGGCAKVVDQLQQGTVALTNFNNALIQLQLTILGNMQAQAKQLAPLVCGTISLGTTIAANPAVAGSVNDYLGKHKAAGQIIAVASELCAVAGLPVTVTAVPAGATVPVPAAPPAVGG